MNNNNTAGEGKDIRPMINCPTCGGNGEFADGKTCSKCKGEGVLGGTVQQAPGQGNNPECLRCGQESDYMEDGKTLQCLYCGDIPEPAGEAEEKTIFEEMQEQDEDERFDDAGGQWSKVPKKLSTPSPEPSRLTAEAIISNDQIIENMKRWFQQAVGGFRNDAILDYNTIVNVHAKKLAAQEVKRETAEKDKRIHELEALILEYQKQTKQIGE